MASLIFDLILAIIALIGALTGYAVIMGWSGR